MALFAGLLACLTLWWLSKNSDGLGRRLRRALGQGLGAVMGGTRTLGAVSLLAGGFLLLHGNLVLAALLGLSGVWMIEGQESMTARLRRMMRSGSAFPAIPNCGSRISARRAPRWSPLPARFMPGGAAKP